MLRDIYGPDRGQRSSAYLAVQPNPQDAARGYPPASRGHGRPNFEPAAPAHYDTQLQYPYSAYPGVQDQGARARVGHSDGNYPTQSTSAHAAGPARTLDSKKMLPQDGYHQAQHTSAHGSSSYADYSGGQRTSQQAHRAASGYPGMAPRLEPFSEYDGNPVGGSSQAGPSRFPAGTPYEPSGWTGVPQSDYYATGGYAQDGQDRAFESPGAGPSSGYTMSAGQNQQQKKAKSSRKTGMKSS